MYFNKFFYCFTLLFLLILFFVLLKHSTYSFYHYLFYF
nr:MAG TPA: hypothetical protein [Caudoviricetes sp.]